MKKICIITLIIFLREQGFSQTHSYFSSKDYITALKQVTDVMVRDVTSPVAASRYYAYITLASYETYVLLHSQVYTFANLLNNYKGVHVEQALQKKADPSFAAVYAIYKMGQRLLPSGRILQIKADSAEKTALKRGLPKELITNTRLLVEKVITQLGGYIQSDGFKNLSGYPRYVPVMGDAYWQPTPPVFMQPIEPYWNRVRPFLLDSAQQFKPTLPAAFDTSGSALFFKQLKEVYDIGKNLSVEQRDISNFWDCNPFAVQQIGHIEFGLKKISPGGHWMGIAGISCLKKKISLRETIKIHTRLALALADGFVSCWDEKYRSNRVRPETAIAKFIDPRWRPLLQTPPFPEYPSGHSIASMVAAVILTDFFGDNFSFLDTSEREFGLPARYFSSFYQAAEEAAISRLYGGIHFRDAIEEGMKQGKAIGNFIKGKFYLFQQRSTIASKNNRSHR
jgi:hypothetical protein